MERFWSKATDITSSISSATSPYIKMISSDISSRIPRYDIIPGSYSDYIYRYTRKSDAINEIRRLIQRRLDVEAGIPSHGRGWDINYLIDILSTSKFNNRKIDSNLIDQLIIEKDKRLMERELEDDEMISIRYPVGGCGSIDEYYKVKDGKFIDGIPTALVQIIDYDYKNKKCRVKDVYTHKEFTIEPSWLEKRARDLTNSEVNDIQTLLTKYNVKMIYSPFYFIEEDMKNYGYFKAKEDGIKYRRKRSRSKSRKRKYKKRSKSKNRKRSSRRSAKRKTKKRSKRKSRKSSNKRKY
jgi:hypothetical protein